MNKEATVMKSNALWRIMVIIGLSAWHNDTAAASVTLKLSAIPEIVTDDVLRGDIIVNAAIFNAPCNLQIKDAAWPLLTGCGAGSDFRNMNLQHVVADNPVSVRFYDAKYKQYSDWHSVRLGNGDNILKQNGKLKHNTSSRVEIRYE
ncbi:MAG: hypothetical protein RR510_15815 [Morganella sp. (in: enterobacteria)]